MSMAHLDGDTIRSALRLLGSCLASERDVEILIVGGAAGVLTGELPGTWTTTDVDVIHCWPPQDREDVLAAAVEAGRRMRFPGSWLSEDVGLFVWTLPDNWTERRVLVGNFDRLRAYAAGRQDLIAMKFLAHRACDLEHLAAMNVTPAELDFVRRHLDTRIEAYPPEAGRIEMTRRYVNEWQQPRP